MQLLGLLALGLAPLSGVFAQVIDTGNPNLRVRRSLSPLSWL